MNAFFKTNRDKTIIALLCICILGAVIYNISILDTPYIFGDEFGYWANAAYMNGLDWNSVGAYNPYYSFGYSLLLAPLFIIFGSTAAMYQAAIVINGLLLVASFCLSIYCVSRTIPRLPKVACAFFCFLVCVYSNTIFQSKNTQAETLLYCLYWLIIAEMISFINSPKSFKSLIIGGLSALVYFTHMRSIGVVISVFLIFLLFVVKEHEKKRYLFLLAISFFILFGAGNILKNILITNIYSNPEITAANDFGGQVGKIAQLFSIEGIKNFLDSILGKIYYLTAATFFVWIFFGLYCLKQVKLHSFKVENRNTYIFAFLLLSLCGTLAISSLYMSGSTGTGRIDTLVYGRYNEFIIGPILLYGIIAFYECKNSWKVIFFCVYFFAILSLYIFGVSKSYQGSYMVYANVVGIAQLANITGKFSGVYYPFLIYIQVVLVIVTILILRKCLEKFSLRTEIAFVILGVAWLYIGISLSNQQNMDERSEYRTNNKISEIIQNSTICNEIYYVTDENESSNMIYLNADSLQFLLPYKNIKTLSYENIQNIGTNDFVVVCNASSIYEEIAEQYHLVEKSDRLSLFVTEYSDLYDESMDYKKDVEIEIEPEDIYTLSSFESNEFTTISSENSTITSTELTLPRGNYILNYEFRCDTENEIAGYCVISKDKGEKVIQSIEINGSMFHDGKAEISLPFSLYSTTSGIEFRVYTFEEAQLELTKLSYYQFPNIYTPGLDSSTEMQALTEDILRFNYASSVVYLNSTEDNIDISVLQSMLKDIEVSVCDFPYDFDNSEFRYVIADKGYFDWFDLLSEYVVLAQYENHILLVSADAVSDGEHVLSDGEYASLSLIQKQSSDYYISNVYSLKEGGEYEVILELDNNDDIMNGICIDILSGENIIEEFTDIEYESTVSMIFHTNSAIDDLRFRIYTEEDKKEITYNSGSIARLKDQVTYVYDEQLKPLLDIAELISNQEDIITILADGWKKVDQENISEYLRGRNFEFFEFELQSEEAERKVKNNLGIPLLSYPKTSWLITSINLPMIYEFLPDYTVVKRTNWYALLVRNDQTEILRQSGLSFLSNGMQLFSDFFRQINEDGTIRWNISIPGGTYEMNFDIQRTEAIEISKEAFKLEIWNDRSLVETVSFETGEEKFTLSSQNGFSNLKFNVLEEIAGMFKVELTGIEKISDAYKIKLNNMQSYAGQYDENMDSITTSNDTIYGPYSSLDAGTYDVIFSYQTDYPTQVSFDIAANGGEILTNSSGMRPKKTENGYQITLSVILTDEVDRVEYRTYVPEGIICTLQSIEIIPKE